MQHGRYESAPPAFDWACCAVPAAVETRDFILYLAIFCLQTGQEKVFEFSIQNKDFLIFRRGASVVFSIINRIYVKIFSQTQILFFIY